MYQVKFPLIFMFLSATSVQMAMFSISLEYYDRLQEMVLKVSFGHILKAVMFFIKKAGQPKEQNIT